VRIKAVETLRGELVLSSLNKSLRAGQEIAITDKSFWNEDVQIVYNAGKIVVSEGGGSLPKPGERTEERYVLRSNHEKPLVFDAKPAFSLAPGATLTVSARQFDTASVQQAIVWNMIELVNELAATAQRPPQEPEVGEDEDEDETPRLQTVPPRPVQQKPKDDVDVEMLDEAERFKLTRQAQTITRDTPEQPKDSYIYDPHNTRSQKKVPPKDAYIYDPHKEQQTPRPSPTLPVRGQIKPVGMTLSPLQESQLKQASAPQSKRVSGAKRIRPVGGGGVEGLGDDGVDIEML
jgi:hypothetical protein